MARMVEEHGREQVRIFKRLAIGSKWHGACKRVETSAERTPNLKRSHTMKTKKTRSSRKVAFKDLLDLRSRVHELECRAITSGQTWIGQCLGVAYDVFDVCVIKHAVNDESL